MCTRVVYLGTGERIVTGRSMDWKSEIGTNLWAWRTVIDHTATRYFFESALSPNTFWVELGNLDFTEGTQTKRLTLGEGEKTVYAGDASAQFESAEPFTFLGAPAS